MPVRGMTGDECPLDALYGEAVLNVPVFCDVPLIIEIDEIALGDLPEGHEGGDSEEKDDEQQMLFCRHRMVLVGGWQLGMFTI